ncbi:MAG: trypsin-like peptidase domain-containing protein [Labilithrix sp.]
MILRALPALLVLAAVGCAVDATEDVRQARAAKVVGDTNELVAVAADGSNLAPKYRRTLDAFGLMRFDDGRNHCTVTHVGGGVVVTAGHCFDAPRTRTDDVACPDAGTRGYAIAWGYRQDREPYLTSTCERILSMQHTGDTDYAIFRVSPAPVAAVRPELTARPKLGATVTIFSHPSHRPLEWSQTCTVQPLPVDASIGGSEFLHECDTEPASSGATVLDDATLAVVGIHDGAWHDKNYATYLADTPLRELLGALGTH